MTSEAISNTRKTPLPDRLRRHLENCPQGGFARLAAHLPEGRTDASRTAARHGRLAADRDVRKVQAEEGLS